MQITLHLIPRQAAIAAGLKHYFTGLACLRGHIDERKTDRKYCLTCKLEKDREKLAMPGAKERRAEYDRKRWENDREYLVTKNRRYYEANADTVNEQKREYRAKNIPKMAVANKIWRDANRHVIRHLLTRRKAYVKQATPPWADMDAIKKVYAEADSLSASTGVLHHVDHIVPLKGKTVCGLHIAINLQPLPWRENISKKNKFVDDGVIRS